VARITSAIYDIQQRHCSTHCQPTQEAAAVDLFAHSTIRAPAGNSGPSQWFGYYAGYSPIFVEQAISHLDLKSGDIVVDPWNGSGTTTQVLREQGMIGRGFDINHAVVLVAKARLLGSDIKPSHLGICRTILSSARSLRDPEFLLEEPLTAWFSPRAAGEFRGIERAIQSILLPGPRYLRLAGQRDLRVVSPIAAFFYVALFRTVRGFLHRFTTSNPTWIKDAPSPSTRLRPTREAIRDTFRREVHLMFSTAGPRMNDTLANDTSAEIGRSTSIRLERDSADAVITSPPYCTRIDYAVATKPELAVLGVTRAEFQRLRVAMLGTPLTATAMPKPNSCWGTTCNRLLQRIKEHPSRASKTYYHNTHLLYFDRLFRSIKEISRVLRSNGHCAFVVRDSYYKNLHNDLAKITVAMCREAGLELRAKHNRGLSTTMAAVNTRSLKYRSDFGATESVLVFARN